MSIIVTAPQPAGVVGPGLNIGWGTDLPGPILDGSHVQLTVQVNPPTGSALWSVTEATTATGGFLPVMLKTSLPHTFDATQAVPDDVTMSVSIELTDPSNQVIDSGQTTMPWSNTVGIGAQIFQEPTTGGGLTTEQADQLTAVFDATAITKLFNNLLVEDISGPDGGFTSRELVAPVFGVIVRITSLPAGLTPQTPDGDYWVSTLAVVRIFRGQDLWLRAPVHTSSKIVSLYGEALLLGLNPIWGTNWLEQMSLQVTFLTGVTGQVLLMRTP